MVADETNEQQVRRWLCGVCLAVAGAVVGAAKLFGAGEAVAGMLVFPVCLFLAGAVLAALAALMGGEARRVAAAYRPAVGFAVRIAPPRWRSFVRRLRVEALARLGVDAEILAVLALAVGVFGALTVLAGTI